jgi:hypothetical protein
MTPTSGAHSPLHMSTTAPPSTDSQRFPASLTATPRQSGMAFRAVGATGSRYGYVGPAFFADSLTELDQGRGGHDLTSDERVSLPEMRSL